MPIRPENRHHYGKAWRELRTTILARAENRCECRGECDEEHFQVDEEGDRVPGDRCNAPNLTVVARCDEEHPGLWVSWELADRAAYEWRPVRIVLTVAHLNHEAGDDRPENLRAMCQRCHLRLDRHQHAATARATRHRKLGPELPLGPGFGERGIPR